METSRVAIIGGGITGAVCARELFRRTGGRVNITVFDQGRGLGGRTSHRRVAESGEYVLPNAPEAAFAFDHGCQFFRADTAQFREELLQEWLEKNFVAEWTGDFGALGSVDGAADFFGFPFKPPYYCGIGGMHSLACALLADAAEAGVSVRPGVRVAGTSKLASGAWLLSGTSGPAAFHDTAEEEAARASKDTLGEFDAVVVTDVSASMAGWHRASAGIPEEIASRVRGRTRVVLFTALVAFEEPLKLDKQAFSAVDDTLWFAARTRSKPGLQNSAQYDCWTLVSTPKYAAAEVERVPMQDPKTGAFRPQEMSYIREVPSATLIDAFQRLLAASEHKACTPFPKVVYVGGQRWGSSFPAPANVGGRDQVGRGASTVEVLGVAYDSAASLPLVPADDAAKPKEEKDFLADDEMRLYYASDYVSMRSPGVEAAALSGLDAARHVASVLGASSQ
eukprot:gnl/TRDRNA2_/TRDRNA2_198011_c0_seq1.p1 gnl/TRDRNA2_/TRDRNA2_198011_c0~~gnl/TRDRNA2_/TRDRNA2_198011_c0_seq1.p1  ORF type:complete len:451 (+),score=84.30 gnl/TRDRNA2_/TRDRNA2_198011_c0_seq1:69-1421(+)